MCEREREERIDEPWRVELDEGGAVLADLLLEVGLRQGHHIVGGGRRDGHGRGGEEEQEAEGFAGDLRGRHERCVRCDLRARVKNWKNREKREAVQPIKYWIKGLNLKEFVGPTARETHCLGERIRFSYASRIFTGNYAT